MNESATQRDWLELSLAQQAIWLEAKLNPQYALQLGGWARIEGSVDPSLARQAVRLTMARHDALRIRVDDELSRQWIDDSGEVPLAIVTLPSEDDPDQAFQRYMEDALSAPFPLGPNPLFHIALVRVSNRLTFMLWRFHHLIADSLSATIAMRHWTEAYLALTSDEPVALAPGSSYRSLIDSDAAYLDSEEYKQDKVYWLRRFDPLPPPLITSASDPMRRKERSRFYGDWYLNGDLWNSFLKCAKQWEISAARALFSLFGVSVATQYQECDLVLGLALHRRDASSRQALGVFSGVVPIRYRIDPAMVLRDFLGAFNQQMDRDLRHQRMPVDHLARALELFRARRSRLFDVVMSYLPADRVHNDALSEGLPVTSGTAVVPEASPISLHVTEQTAGLHIRVAVNPSILDDIEVEALLSLLQEVVVFSVTMMDDKLENLFAKNKTQGIVEDESFSEEDREDWVI